MKKILLVISIIFPFWIILSSFIDGQEVRFPEKKVLKEIKKAWKTESVVIDKVDIDDVYYLGNFYSLSLNNEVVGYLYLGRVNSCREGGCAITLENEEAVAFEYFDYFFITDSAATIKKIKVFNYQATQGHEVMSVGWLRQYIGFDGDKKLRYGRDIEAISGATISAKAINEDVFFMVNILKNRS